MTIFDVIKYPIGYPPTADQLAALPEPIYEEFCTKIFNWTRDPDILARVIRGQLGLGNEYYVQHMEFLRQLIREYQE